MLPSTEGGSPSSTKKNGARGHDPTISPPPAKRRVQSTTSNEAVAAFFTPSSQKPKTRTVWSERAASQDPKVLATLLIATYHPSTPNTSEPPSKRRKIAAFDLDATLITSASGKKHSDDPMDWKWWDIAVPARLKALHHEEGYQVVILTNQAGLPLHRGVGWKGPKNTDVRIARFKQKCAAVFANLDLPLRMYAATGKDVFRKPRAGMWDEVCQDYGGTGEVDGLDLPRCFFVGDAGGRPAIPKGGLVVPRDFSCSDRNLAYNIGLAYHTPEEFFLGEEPRSFVRDFDLAAYPFAIGDGTLQPDIFEAEGQNVVLFCGPPGAGKSTFYRRQLEPLGYERINQDTLVTKSRCFKAATEYLRGGKSIVIDNTNPDPDTRVQWVELARKNKVVIRCVWFKTPVAVCEHNDVVRSLNESMNPEARQSLPKLAFNSFMARFREPKAKEGFQDVLEVDFRFRGTEDEYAIWGRYWL